MTPGPDAKLLAGMKAYHGADGRMRLFRPEANMARLLRSAHRLQLATFEPQARRGASAGVKKGFLQLRIALAGGTGVGGAAAAA